jgi:hypothetical protein
VSDSWIPSISDLELGVLLRGIRPTYRFNDTLHYIEPCDPRRAAYTWDPKPAEEATGLTPLRDVRTYHTFGYYGFFKPSVAEVLAQIPSDLIESVVAFEIVESPQDAADLDKEREALNAGYHVAVTRLYGASRPLADARP